MAYPFKRLSTKELERYFRKMIREGPSKRNIRSKIPRPDFSDIKNRADFEMLKRSKISRRPT